jgi:glutaryl-CoA dehydrogenase
MGTQAASSNSIVADYKVARFFADCEALSLRKHVQMQNLILGKAVTGFGAFV